MSNLYLHIPFCKQRCIYCDFYFVTTHKSTRSFVDALCKEIEIQGKAYGHLEAVDTIYFGGGTPSQLSNDEVSRILDILHTSFDTSNASELTFEINPDDVDSTYLKALRNSGINRLSIGIQSFSDKDLQWMNRAHTKEQAKAVIDLARDTGFSNFSIDLIFGLPLQTEGTWQHSLLLVQELAPPHISTYSLTVEPGTVLHKRIQNNKDRHPEEENVAHLYRTTMNALRQYGYEHYEVSSFALDGFRSQHNQAYWTHKNYLGFGPSAHSFWRNEGLSATRWKNASNLRMYIDQLASSHHFNLESETISTSELLDEYLMLRLRTIDGLNLRFLSQTFGLDLQKDKGASINRLTQAGLIRITDTDHLHLTDQGFAVCDAVISELLI